MLLMSLPQHNKKESAWLMIFYINFPYRIIACNLGLAVLEPLMIGEFTERERERIIFNLINPTSIIN